MSRNSTLYRLALRGSWALLTIGAFSILCGTVVRAADVDLGGGLHIDAVAANEEEANTGSLVGPWQVQSLAILGSNGKREEFGQRSPRPLSAVFDDNTVTLSVGAESIAKAPYTSDSKQNPSTIDVKSDAGALLGIYQRHGNRLQISMNDEAKGRPADFKKEKSGLVLVLRRFPAMSLYIVDADGGNRRQIATMPEFTSLGSPDWSHDGGKIAIDATRSIFGEDWSTSHVLVVDVDGGSPKDLGRGGMPSWSHDDKQLTYIQYEPERGVGIMNADGSNRQLVDANGWGSQWSPRSNEIAYALSEDGRPNICIYDVATKKRRTLLDKTYRQIYEGFTWSPDGKWICFKADLPEGGSEVAAVAVAGEKEGFKVLLPKSAPESCTVSKTMAWGGNGDQILVTMQSTGDRMLQLHVLDFAGVEPPRLFSGCPADWVGDDMAWSPDGKKVVFTATAPSNR